MARPTNEERARRAELFSQGVRECARCKATKSLADFNKSSTQGHMGYTPKCRSCLKALRDAKPNDPTRSARLRANMIQRRYGLTVEQFDTMLIAQGGGCAVCGIPASRSTRSFAVDHDHSCCPGENTCGRCVRGILCHSCNVALGLLQDDADRIDRAAQYIRSAQLQPPAIKDTP